MTCEECKHILDRKDLPHTIRTCRGCGRKMYVHESGEHGRGIKVQEGDTFVLPREWLTLHFNPLKGSGRFFKAGLAWFAKLIFLEEMPRRPESFAAELERMEKASDKLLTDSDLLQGLDIGDPECYEAIVRALEDKRESAEWWALMVRLFVGLVRDAVEKDDLWQAVWAMSSAERCRSMQVFKEHLEEAVWMGHSAHRLIDALTIWKKNKSNSDEEFWQQTFNQNSYVLSQVFSVPVVFIKDRAYVGGMNIDRSEARFVDYLFSSESSREALLAEIKTPETRLLGAKYRGIYKPASELAGGLVQVLDYRRQLVTSLEEIKRDTAHELSVFNPKCILIAGNGQAELTSSQKRASFELFRTGLKDVEVVTYDELFRKTEVLATLFNLVRS